MRDFDQEFDQEFDSSWEPPSSPKEDPDFDSSWKPPTRRIRGPSGLGEEVEGDLPPLASETPKEEEEEYPFTGPMPFSLRENPNRPPTPTPTDEYSKVFGRIGDVASGTTDIFGQPYDRPGSPSVKKLSVFPTDDEESVLPEMKSEPETWIGGFGKGLYNEFGRWAANPSTMLSSMEPGPAAAKTALADILKIGESPAAKLAKSAYSKAKTASLPKTKTPEDVAALEAQLRGTLAEPFRPGALETGPVAPNVDLSTGIPKPRIDAATFAQMRDARAIETARAEQAANAARVAPDPPRPAPKINVNPQTGELVIPGVNAPAPIEAMPEVAPEIAPTYHPAPDWPKGPTKDRYYELVAKEQAGTLTGDELIEAQRLNKQLRNADIEPIIEPAPIQSMPETAEIAPSRIDELGQMPVEELESIATPTTLDEVGTPNFGGLTEPIIPEGLADEIPIPEEVIPEAPIPEPIPESPITAERDLVESQIDETSPISSMPESQEPPLAVLDEAIEPEILPESIPEELVPEVLPEPETPPAIGSMPEESPWIGEEIEAPKPKTKAELKKERIAAKKEKAAAKWAGISKPSEGPAKMLTKGEVPAIESMPKETPSAPKPTKITPIEEMPIGSLPGEEGITEGIITSQDKADFRAREEEMKEALKGKRRASETGALEDRPSYISEEGEEIGVPPEDIQTSKAKAEEMKRALEGKKRAGSRMSMPEMGRSGELPPDKPQTMFEKFMKKEEVKAPSEPKEIPLLRSKNFKERLKGEKGALTISKGPSKPPSKPPTPPPFSWGSPGKAASGGIGSKGPLDVLKRSKFGEAIGKAYEASPYESVLGRTADVAGNAMKSFMSTGDLSGLLRQGGALVHKKEWREAAPKMIEMFKDEAVYTKRMGHIKKDPLFKFADESGLSLPGINRGKEERFASDIAHSIPGFGKLSQASDNAYTGFLNELRFNTFTTLLNDAVKAGYKPGREKGELAKEIAKFVNDATGTTHLGKVGEPAARLLNSLIYSPKLGASRIQMIRRINPADPKFYSQGKFVRKEALKSAFALAGMNLTTNAVTAALGGKVTYDILNSDFVKNRAGDTRVDMGAGFLQPLVLAARIMSDKYTSSTSGKTYDLGTDYGQTSTEDLLKRYLISKEAPIAGLVSDIWSGKDWQGKDKNRAIAIGERFTPLILQDMYDIVREDPRMAPLIVPGFFGASVQTYGKPEKKMKLSMPKMGVGL